MYLIVILNQAIWIWLFRLNSVNSASICVLTRTQEGIINGSTFQFKIKTILAMFLFPY
jgi:hypothetical protein